jgi:hypothetical protein
LGSDNEKCREHRSRERGGGERDRGQLRAVEEPAGRVAWGTVHRIGRGGLGDEGYRRADIHEQLQHDDVHGVKRGGQPKRQRHGDNKDQRNLRAQVEGDRAP